MYRTDINIRRVVERRSLSLLIFGVFLLVGTGCSSLPDYANPAEWYKGAIDWVTGDNIPANSDTYRNDRKKKKLIGFPRADQVPDRPKRPTTLEINRMKSGLVSDRKSSQYSDKKVRSGEDITSNNGSTENIGLPNVSRSELPGDGKHKKQSSVDRTPGTGTSVRSDKMRGVLSKPVLEKSYSNREFNTAIQKSPPEDMVSVTSSNNVFVQADQFSPRFPAGTSSAFLPTKKFNQAKNQFLGFGLPVAIVYFKNNSATLNIQAKDRIRRVLRLYQDEGRGTIKIIGHASSRTPNMVPPRHHLANLKVSNKRANAVADELMRLGVKPNMIIVSAIADQEPAFFEVMPAGEAGNRRAEIFFAR